MTSMVENTLAVKVLIDIFSTVITFSWSKS